MLLDPLRLLVQELVVHVLVEHDLRLGMGWHERDMRMVGHHGREAPVHPTIVFAHPALVTQASDFRMVPG